MIQKKAFASSVAAATGLLFTVAATPALAHHPLGGLPMTTFGEGLLSGIGHPLLGFDHLFFVLVMGVVASFTGRQLLAPAGYIAAMLVGCLAMSLGVGLPLKELVIAISLVVIGGVALSGKHLSLIPAMLLFAAFGLFHGSAFGDTIATQEGGAGTMVLVGYLIGLGVLQYAISVGAGWAVRKFWNATDAMVMQPRLAGAMVAGVGIFLTLETIEGFVFG